MGGPRAPDRGRGTVGVIKAQGPPHCGTEGAGWGLGGGRPLGCEACSCRTQGRAGGWRWARMVTPGPKGLGGEAVGTEPIFWGAGQPTWGQGWKCRALDLGAGWSGAISELVRRGAGAQRWRCKVSGWRTRAAWAWGAAALGLSPRAGRQAGCGWSGVRGPGLRDRLVRSRDGQAARGGLEAGIKVQGSGLKDAVLGRWGAHGLGGWVQRPRGQRRWEPLGQALGGETGGIRAPGVQ